MTLRTQLFVTVSVALLATLISGCSPKADFQTFAPKECPFSASFPAKPEYRAETTTVDYGSQTLHSYSVKFDDVVYGINCSILPGEVNEQMKQVGVQNVLKAGRDGTLKRRGWTMVEERGERLDISPSRSVLGTRTTAKTPDGKNNVKFRQIWWQNQMYQVMVVLPHKPSYNQEIYPERFLDSFKIVL